MTNDAHNGIDRLLEPPALERLVHRKRIPELERFTEVLQSAGVAPPRLGGWRLLEVLHEKRTLIVKLDGTAIGQPIPLALAPRGKVTLTAGKGGAAIALLAQPR